VLCDHLLFLLSATTTFESITYPAENRLTRMTSGDLGRKDTGELFIGIPVLLLGSRHGGSVGRGDGEGKRISPGPEDPGHNLLQIRIVQFPETLFSTQT